MKPIKINEPIPYIAYPTILLSLVSFTTWLLMFYLRFYSGYSWYTTIIPSTLSTYLAFTPLHDAVHGSVSKYKKINNIPAYLTSIQFFYSPPSVFRIVHLLHHRYTNEPDLDPDYFSTSRYTLLLPFKWMVHLFHYFGYFYKLKGKYPEQWRTLYLWNLFFVGPVICVFPLWDLLVLWIIPAQIAIIFMVCMFDYVPHKPHKVTRKQDIYKCTNVIDRLFSEELSNREIPHESMLISLLTLNQAYHSIHHLYPRVPFYRYRAIWKKYGEEFKRRGVESVPIVVKPNIEIPCINPL